MTLSACSVINILRHAVTPLYRIRQNRRQGRCGVRTAQEAISARVASAGLKQDHPLKAVRRAAALEAKKQIERLKKLDLSDEDFYYRDLVDRWLETLRRHAAESR